MTQHSILWHDYETSGLEPDRARPLQFAAIRTDENLEELDEIEIRAELSPEVLPDPVACLVTGVVPGDFADQEVSELEFATRIRRAMMVEGTCTAGYNSGKFDAEFTRFLFWRCLLLPVYDPEWKNGNSRWDLIDALRTAYALRPEGINWPRHSNGKPSFRLSDLAEENDIDQGDAHDALVDVRVTIEMARLLRRSQPRLFRFLYEGRKKASAVSVLKGAIEGQSPLVHISSKFGSEVACASIIVPICHVRGAQYAAIDLRYDPQPLLDEDSSVLRKRLYSSRDKWPADAKRVGVHKVQANLAPVLAGVSVMNSECWDRIELDWADVEPRVTWVQENIEELRRVVRDLCAFDDSGEASGSVPDPESALYRGFPSDACVSVCERVHENPPSKWPELAGELNDDGLRELLFRLRCREDPEGLDEADRQEWSKHLRSRLLTDNVGAGTRVEQVRREIGRLRAEHTNDERGLAILERLDALVEERTAAL